VCFPVPRKQAKAMSPFPSTNKHSSLMLNWLSLPWKCIFFLLWKILAVVLQPEDISVNRVINLSEAEFIK
jgi:hypothetical protein